MIFGYYLERRPEITPLPDGVSAVSYLDPVWCEAVGGEIWGWACCPRPLTQAELDAYGLVPDESNPVRYRQYGVLERGVGPVREPDGRVFATSYRPLALTRLLALRRGAARERYALAVFTRKE